MAKHGETIKYLIRVPSTTMKKTIEWHETKMIEEIDQAIEVIENAYSVTLESGYLDTFNAIHIVDWKDVAETWLGGLIEDLQSLLEEIGELPDDELGEYEVNTGE